MKFSNKTLFMIYTAANAFMVQSVHAQASEPATDTSQVKAVTLEDIIVTAQKRSENLQDVPIAVSSLKATQLEAVGVSSVVDLRVAIPALNSTNTIGYFTSTIRGVGSFSFGPGIESPIALYVDGVYIAAPQASTLSLNNIASIEVLKGPQGTLFGRNATGGLIQVTTATPSQERQGRFSLSYGNYETVTAAGYVAGGVGEGLAGDLAVYYKTQGNGFGKNITTGSDVNKVDHEFSMRSKWVWDAHDGTTVTLIGDYSDVKDSQSTFSNFPGKLSGFIPGRIAPDLGYNSESDFDTLHQGWGAGGSLRIDQDIGTVRLSSITAYRKSRYDFREDLDFTSQPLTYLDQIQRDRQFSQELQVSSTEKGPLQWTAGLYYFNLKSSLDPFILSRANIDGTYLSLENTQKAESSAVYGQATYEVATNTRLTLGGRFTKERRQEKNAQLDLTIVPIAMTIPISFPDRKVNFSKFTWRISLDHRFSDGVLAYASYNRGFKSGGYNTFDPGFAPFRPETLDAYELGLKTELLDRRLRMNVAGFYYDYSDIQVPKIGVAAADIVNGATARIYGLDADITAVISNALSLTGGVGWISPKFRSFPNCPTASAQGGTPLIEAPCDGNQIPFASKLTFSLAANYTVPLAGGELQATGNVYYNSGVFFEPDNFLKQDRYALLGGALKWKSAEGLSVGIFGKNLTDRRVIAFAATQGGGNQTVSYSEPRTYGVTLGYEF